MKIDDIDHFSRELAEAIANEMHLHYGIEVETETRLVVKTNEEKHGITVDFADSFINPTVYADEYFDAYQNGESIESIAAKMSKVAYDAHQHGIEMPELSEMEAKKHIRLTLVNTQRNEKLLANCPHFEVGDLSAIPRWYIDDNASFVVTEEIAARIGSGLTPDEVLKIGQQNIDDMTYDIRSMSDVLREMLGAEGMENELMDSMIPEMEGPHMIVMSTMSHIQGAASILSEKALHEVRDMMDGSDYVILPSSIHEVICVPINDSMTPDDLRSMVREVNMNCVSPSDFLSDNVYRYDGQKLSMIHDNLKMDQPKTEGPKMDERTMHYVGMTM